MAEAQDIAEPQDLEFEAPEADLIAESDEAVIMPEAIVAPEADLFTEAQAEDPCSCLTPMKEWIERDPESEECRPCALPIVTDWYQSELEERGEDKLAAQLKEACASETITNIEIAQQLDQIKEKVSEDLADRLREFDCSIQVNVGEVNANLNDLDIE